VLVLMSLITREFAQSYKTLFNMFDLNKERNFPSYYSSMGLFATTVLGLWIGRWKKNAGDPFWKHWVGLGYVFLLLSVDEMISLHEWFSVLLHDQYHPTGWFQYPWVIPAIVFVAVFAGSYLKMLAALPRPLAKAMVICGAVFVTGAVGFEMLEAKWASTYGNHGYFFWFLTQIEEILEMYSIAFFNFYLLKYLAEHVAVSTVNTRER
jgi:hypothetical protein